MEVSPGKVVGEGRETAEGRQRGKEPERRQSIEEVLGREGGKVAAVEGAGLGSVEPDRTGREAIGAEGGMRERAAGRVEEAGRRGGEERSPAREALRAEGHEVAAGRGNGLEEG